MLGSCHRGDVLRIGIGGGSAGQASVNFCGLWGGLLVSPGALERR